jgi:putative ABC transport system ATP-binding protein
MTAAKPVMSVRGVTKTFGTGDLAVHAIRGVDMDVYAGEVVLVMGPSGSGKTTLLSVMGALLKPTAGEVWIGAERVSDLPEAKLPKVRLRNLGFVFQDYNLLSAISARENVEIVMDFAGVSSTETRRRAEELLADLGLAERLDFRPRDMSGGEKQRVAIARALANEPLILLCDEPTANLDSKIGHDIIVRLRAIADDQGRSVVIVSHDERIKPHADRVLWLEDGAFTEMAQMAIDPVCGMAVERETAPASFDNDGEMYYFCSRGCRSEFIEDLEAAGGSEREAAD